MADTDDDQWRFSLSDLPDEDESESDNGSESDGAGSGNIAGQMVGPDEDLEPGTPSLENSFFVLLGALVTLLVVLVMAGAI